MIPLRFTELDSEKGSLLFVADSGRAFLGSSDFLERYVADNLSNRERGYLSLFDYNDGPAAIGQLFELARRHHVRSSPNYFILVPTLRCDLDCSYCQVSRVNQDSGGHDWNDQTTESAIRLIQDLAPTNVKLEFQGGEPSLRLDLIEQVMNRLEQAGKKLDVVICTNLNTVGEAMLRLMDRGNVSISTSIDGAVARQARQRTREKTAAHRVYRNFQILRERYGAERLSAIATVDLEDPPSYEEITDTYRDLGLDTVFIRPINYQGFARKRHASSRDADAAWLAYYTGLVDYLISHGNGISDFYTTHLLKRIFQAGANGHTDLRNPAYMGTDFLVIDYDGRLFPTDEARMLDRIGEADFSLGDVFEGIDEERRALLNQTAFNEADPDCQHCPFQPYCGTDIIDTISRYGRLDLPRGETSFCRTHFGLFSHIFQLLSDDAIEAKTTLSQWLGLPQPPRQFLERLT
ncbi:His-Xaa-Ser system radical SAM maturase HxsB [Parvularcula flava]|uniref:His-Xaa-Ser system radical SAM maturase HxsB n=1 Tax=Aquisalinus luteolus TaxID=1566827 RepID=A0A8J3EQ98_9PROT|nr:His-Xaa-Ser system radical SAM maturase HxsB [Aquisalinus luteolus]NHK27160.1 His-Xaa-Ser system radical SAM maturase HxsB [Aquisalinus luteolus]GGH94579.1 His-Xaa-Ser system radical SAM maturase HxsB [Aquisalinus luteolus]